MRLSDILELAKQYLFLGIIIVIAWFLLFLVGYFLVYKKLMHGKKKASISKSILYGTVIIYAIIVLGGTFLSRNGGNQGTVSLHILSSYINAWNSFSIPEWRNLILNILMFVPLGFLLPLIFKKCEKWYVTYLLGLIGTLFIETLQLVTKSGVFEIDDIINNTLGCTIGYGIIMIYILNKDKKYKNRKKKNLITAVVQIPLLITVITFATIFFAYSRLELGNLKYAASYSINMDKVNVSSDIIFDKGKEKAYVYEIPVGNKEKAIKYANEFFSTLNTSVDEKRNDVYDDTVICTSTDGKYQLWVNYLGFTNSFHNFSLYESKGQANLGLSEVVNLLKSYNINIPKDSDFEDKGNGEYVISINMVNRGDDVVTGEITCTVDTSNNVVRFNNNILSLKPYKQYDIISEEDAYNKILNGDFSYFGELKKNSKINIIDVDLKYEIDSKGFYQPVYSFAAKTNGYSSNIIIPALNIDNEGKENLN